MAICPRHGTQAAMKNLYRRICGVALTLLLGACASTPVPPDWQANASEALKGFSAAYLSGNTRLADFEFARARAEIARTGRGDWMARAELTRCAVRVASLEFDNCAGYQSLAADAGASEQAYAAFLSGQWNGLDTALLPAQHRALVSRSAAATTASAATVGAVEDPLARLVAAGVLLQRQSLLPADIAVATETASGQGWRRPLLAWLAVQSQRANAAGDRDAAARIQRRIDLVLQGTSKTP
jgi:hypothetical protein